MFKNPIAPNPNPAAKKVREPLKPQPKYDNRNKMFPAGDYYGTGFKAKVGKMRGDSPGMNPVPPKAMRKPPKSLA